MKAELDATKFTRGMTMYVAVRRGRELKWRVWCATKLIVLAALIMGCGIDIKVREASETQKP